MSIPAESTRVVMKGHADSSEIFECGFWLTGNAPISDAAAKVLADIIAAFWQPTATRIPLTALIASGSGWDSLTVYGYPTGGPTAASVGEADLTGGAGSSSNFAALQQSYCVTIESGLSGRRNRGRIYLPANGVPVGSGHFGDATVLGNALTGLGTFFTAINDDGAIGDVAVVSTTGSVATQATAIRGDQRMDIQRRRANKQSSGTRTTITL